MQDGVFLDADSEYLNQKIVCCMSRELWVILSIFSVVTLFQSTQTPLEVGSLQNFIAVLDSLKPLYDSCNGFSLADGQICENRRFLIFSDRIFRKIMTFDQMSSV